MHDFIYFADLNNEPLCWNFAKTGKLYSPSLIELPNSSNETYKLYTTNPDSFLKNCETLQFGFVSPRLEYLILSCWHRNGMKIGLGEENTKWFGEEDISRIHRIAELEVQFEKVRRQIDENLPSRLASLFLAENNLDGKIMLQNMFGNKKNFCIVPVRIFYQKRFFKADSKWIGEYEKTQSVQAIENYWLGNCCSANPQFEYLVEGHIELINDDDRKLFPITNPPNTNGS